MHTYYSQYRMCIIIIHNYHFYRSCLFLWNLAAIFVGHDVLCIPVLGNCVSSLLQEEKALWTNTLHARDIGCPSSDTATPYGTPATEGRVCDHSVPHHYLPATQHWLRLRCFCAARVHTTGLRNELDGCCLLGSLQGNVHVRSYNVMYYVCFN